MASTSQLRQPINGVYVQGSILRIQLKNFMTYSELDFRPGPRMNVIIGANGTGKSTIMCAICLGLGGKPGLIGRATQIKDYVKIGRQTGRILIELSVDGDNVNCVIGCEITRTGNGASSFTLNGRAAKVADVKEMVSRYNIQMDNLCQFLPQDRVVEFVKMTSQELLKNTEKAAGEAGMFEDHCKLTDWHSKANELVVTCSRLKEDLDKESQRRLRFEEQVKNYHHRQTFLQKIEMLEQKKCWIEYDVKRQQYVAVKSGREQAQNDLAKMKTEQGPMNERVNELTNIAKECAVKLEKTVQEFKKQKDFMQTKLALIEKQDEKARDLILQFNQTVKMEDARCIRLQELKQQLEFFENELTNLVDNQVDAILELNNVGQRIQTVSLEISMQRDRIDNATTELRNLERELEGVHQELKRLQDVGYQRLQVLRRSDEHAYNAVLWLRENSSKLKKTIHEPIMTVINVNDPKYAKYVERSIPFKDMVAFVCEDQDDLEVFMSTLSDNQNLRINVVLAPRDRSPADYRPNVDIDSLRQYGFQCYLKDAVSAPEAVLCYLCQQYNLHRVPIGNERTRDCVEEVINNTQFTRFFTENHQYAVKTSMYGARERSTSSNELTPARLLTLNFDSTKANKMKEAANELKSRREQAVAQKKDLELKERELKAHIEQLRTTKKELLQKRDHKRNLRAMIAQKQEIIQHCEDDAVDVNAITENAKKELLNVSFTKVQILKVLSQLALKLLALSKQRMHASMKMCTMNFQKAKMQDDYNQNQRTLLEFEKRLGSLKLMEATAQADAKAFLKIAEKKMGEKSLDELANLFEKSFPNLEDGDLEVLQNEIISLKAQAECLCNTDKSVLKEYEVWKKRIEKLDAAVNSRSEALASHHEEMDMITRRWLPPLKKLVSEINIRFRHYFASLKCAGEVSLSTGENEKDYSKYGICIKVKFRATDQLRELTSQYQSGGEKSVSTILYLLAMQEFIKLPFCCVDEINQGMDSTNERRIFNMMTQTICKENKCQYFLVTPKLLPDLQFGPDVTIHCIQRGSVDIQQDQWKLATFLQKRKSLKH